MIATDLINKTRIEINDNDDTNGYRVSRLDFELWIPDAVREVYRKRPDLRLGPNFEMRDFVDLYRYDASDYYLDGFSDIFGWDKIAYPSVVFTAASDNHVTVSGGGTDLFSFSYLSPFVNAQVVNLLAGADFGGVVYPVRDIASGDSFTVDVFELEIPVESFVERALVFYLAYSAFAVDNEDTFNAGRSVEYLSKFYSELGVPTK